MMAVTDQVCVSAPPIHPGVAGVAVAHTSAMPGYMHQARHNQCRHAIRTNGLNATVWPASKAASPSIFILASRMTLPLGGPTSPRAATSPQAPQWTTATRSAKQLINLHVNKNEVRTTLSMNLAVSADVTDLLQGRFELLIPYRVASAEIVHRLQERFKPTQSQNHCACLLSYRNIRR
jgi:hypothetical protein